MNKDKLENITDALPDIIKDFAEAIKDNFDTHAQEVLSDSTGIVASGIKLLGKPFIDKYFEKLKDKKLENYGLAVYMQAGLIQAIESLEEIKDELKDSFDANSIKTSLKNSTVNFNKNDMLLVFRPKDHPAIIFVKKCYEQLLRDCETSPQAIKQFTKHFNKHIADKIKETFGNDYDAHIAEIKNFTLKDNETDFLLDMIRLGRIGFKETEQLKYEQTYAYWKKVSAFKEGDSEKSEESELQLQPIENLIADYFHPDEDNLDKILFVLADFGKGKSVFLRHYAAKLAKNYLETHEGLFPVYFNLRDFKNYSSEPKLGVIADYLETKYPLKIDDEYFKLRQYIFLVDSLDESGELTKVNTDEVIASVKKIQQLDKALQRTNRIIITSRPFDEGLKTQLISHKPYVIKNSEDREIEYFVSVYGFKKEQFNEWLTDTLRHHPIKNKIESTGFAKEVITAIEQNQQIDIHDTLLNNKTLSASELRRPIFAYMIFQLIINNIDFSAIGKIGVYLSFLNLLTKEAKHINDTSCKVDLKQEFEFRNLLHVIALLWMYERQQGKQGILKKSDICRVLDGENKRETDLQILDRYKSKGVTEIQFLSHSYFGENDNVLHFQHQSFAEILLAEYYLKVFIKYALDEESNIEEARTKLILGEPTEQTIQFLQEMLKLLKDTVCEKNCDITVIEKRKLLFPLMASLCTQKNNKLFCNSIYYEWFKKYPIVENQASYPLSALENWCIDQDKLNNIIKLAKEIIESKTNYILTKAETKTVLYDNELLAIQNKKLSDFSPDIDKWLALLVGNTLYNNIEKEQFFNAKIKNFQHLFDLIKNWNHGYRTSAPIWGRELFMGIDMRENNDEINLKCSDFSEINFSYSYFKNINAGNSIFSGAKFYRNSFINVDIAHADLLYCSISDISFIELFKFGLSIILPYILIPVQLADKYHKVNANYINCGKNKTFVKDNNIFTMSLPMPFGRGLNFFDMFFDTINGLLIYGLKEGKFSIEEIKSWFEFETEELKSKFYAEFDKLKVYECIDTEIIRNDNTVEDINS